MMPFAFTKPSFLHLRRSHHNATSRRPRSSSVVASASSSRFADLFPPSSDTVLTPSNVSISLVDRVNSFTATQTPVLVGWLRHYGCTLCKKQASDWKALQPRLAECGLVHMVLVGNGTPSQAADFVEEMGWTGDMFTDPERKTYAALGFKSGLGVTFTVPALKKTIASFNEGNKQTWSRLPTDAFQQGGAILVDGKGETSLFHADAFAGDHIDLDVLYDKVCSVCTQTVES